MQAVAISSILTVVVAITTTAYADDQVSTPPTTTTTPSASIAAPVDDGNKVICRNVLITGSHFTEKVCAKKSQWEHAGDVSKRALEQDTEQSLQRPAH
jgi:hypothetical protein